VSGDISANTNLYLGGDASFNKDVFISGDISGNSKLYLDDDALLKSNLIVSGDISANTHLYLGGDASLKSKLIVSGDISANTNIYLGGDASLNKHLFVSGVTTLGVVNNTDVPLYVDGSGAMRIPVGSTDNRPTEVETGQIRFNTTDDTFEGYDGSNWGSLGGVSNADKTTQVYVDENNSIVFKTNDEIRETIDGTTGDISINTILITNGDISANTNLYLGGDASLNSGVFIAGDISANTHLYLGGDASLNKDLFVSGVTKLGVVNNTVVPLYVDGSGAMRIPVGSTDNRPGPTDVERGQIRFNTTDDTFEGYDGSNWGSLGGVSNADKSSRVYIDANDSIVFETNSKIRETIDIDGNVSFDVSNSEGYGEINMRQIGTATIMEVKDSSNNNTIKIQNQGDTFKLIYDQSGVDTSSRMEMKDNEIKLYPKYPESTFTSNYNGVMIGNDSELRDSLYDKTWSQIGYINKEGGTKYGNTVSVSQDGKKMAVGEHETTSTTSSVYIYDIYEKDKRLIETININSGHVTSIDINQDGSKVVVGIYDADNGSSINTGGIELYELSDGTYIQVGNIISYGTTEDAQLGHTTSINNDGSIFAAGQYTRNTGISESTIEGGVLIFKRQNESISIIADISNNGTNDDTQFRQMGRSIELNGAGDRIIIGGTYDNSINGTGQHRVYIYQEQDPIEPSTTGSWNEVLDISNIIPNTGLNFGLSVAMSNDGKVIAVATQERDGDSEDGVVFIYELTGDGKPSDLTYTQRGSTIRLSGIDNMDTFGASMSLNADGSVIAIASGSLDNFNGHAYIYKYLNSDWKLVKDIAGSEVENLGGIHNYNDDNMHLISDEDGICLDATGNLVVIGAPNLYSADDMDALGNGSAYLYRNQVYTLGVNEKLRVKGDIVVDNEITYKDQTLDARFVPKQTGNIRAVNWGALSARRFEVHFGSWANNNNSPWADCIHFNTWSDDSGGTSNLLCLKKTGGFGMRIFQPTDTTYQNTTNYTDYRDVVLADTTGNVDITGNLAVNGTATTDIIDYNRRKNPFHPTVNYAEDIITNASNMLENNWYIFAKTNGSQSFGADFCMTINEPGNHLYLDFSVSYHYGSDYVLNVKTNSSFVNMGIQAIKLKKLGSSIYDDVHLLVQVGGDITDDALSANKFNVSMRGNFGNGGLELVSLTNDTTADTYLTYTHSISNIVSMVAHNDVIIFSLNENGTLTVDGDTMTGSLSVGGDITLSGDSIKSNDDTLDIYPNGTSIASTGWIEMRNTGTTIGGKEIYFNTNSSTSNWGTRKMTIADNGNVGIGIDNPSALLHSYSGSFGDNGFSAKFARNVENGEHNGIGLGTANNVMKSAIFQERISSYTSKLHLCNNNDADSTDVALSDAKLTIYSGNVGIGTTNPGAKLDVNGNTKITGELTMTGDLTIEGGNVGINILSSTRGNTRIADGYDINYLTNNVGTRIRTFNSNVYDEVADFYGSGITFYKNTTMTGDTTMNGSLTIGGSSWFHIKATSTDSIGPEDGQFNVYLSPTIAIASPPQAITFEYRTSSSSADLFVYDTNGSYSGGNILPQTSVWTTKSFTPSFSSGLSVNRIRFDPNVNQNRLDVRNLKYGDTFITNQSGYSGSIGYTLNSGSTTFVDKSGVSLFADGGIDIANDLYVAGTLTVPEIQMPYLSDANKICLYGDNYRYSIGWINPSGTKYGGIVYNAMTFTMDDSDGSGFLWRDNVHADNGSQGAMSLTTDGKLTIASNTRIGYGESDTTTPSGAMLDVNGDLSLNGQHTQVVPNANDNNQVFIQTNTSVRRSKQAHHIDTYNHGTSGSDGRQLYLNWYSNSDVSVGGTGGGKLICYNEVEYKGQTLDARFVKVAGDTMTGNLSVSGTVTASSFSGNGSALTGLTKAMVSLSNVDNTSDTAKPISTAQQTALNSKANLASPTFTGTVTAPKFSQSGNDFLIGGKRALVRSTEQLSINWGGDFTSGTYIYLGLTVQNVVSALTFNATSDIRVKTNIETIEPNEALEQINKLEPKTYKFYDSEETHYGLVAQDAEQIIPESVKSTGTKMIPSIGETCKLINSGKTIVLDTKTTTDMVATKLEFDDISGNKQSVGIETFEGEKYIHLKKTIEEHAIKTSDGLTIYVHGHEVNDFRSINYNTIVAANVAATKALTRELNETRTELNETRTELNETRTELNETRTELNETRTELNETRTELNETRTELNETRTELNETRTELNETRTELNETRTELNELKKLVEQLLNK
jgi:hypothetical protein